MTLFQINSSRLMAPGLPVLAVAAFAAGTAAEAAWTHAVITFAFLLAATQGLTALASP